jgi:hypothetical protein
MACTFFTVILMIGKEYRCTGMVSHAKTKNTCAISLPSNSGSNACFDAIMRQTTNMQCHAMPCHTQAPPQQPTCSQFLCFNVSQRFNSGSNDCLISTPSDSIQLRIHIPGHGAARPCGKKAISQAPAPKPHRQTEHQRSTPPGLCIATTVLLVAFFS